MKHYRVLLRDMRRAKRTVQFLLRHPIGSRQKLRSVLRYVAFHVRHCIFPGCQIYSWIGGVRFYADRGYAGIVGNLYVGLHDFEEMSFLLHSFAQQ